VILLDVMLPRLDGFMFREYQRANVPWADIPVIVISALDERASRSLDAAAWFRKPLNLDALTAALAVYC
jgi:two-component system response regulator MprA